MEVESPDINKSTVEEDEEYRSDNEFSGSEISQEFSEATVASSKLSPAAEDSNSSELIKRAQEINLTTKESVFLASVLEDTISQMVILSNCNRKLICRQLEKAEEDDSNERDQLNDGDLANATHKLAKMNSDREYVTDTFCRIYLDLKQHRSFAAMLVQLGDLAAKTYKGIAEELKHKDNTKKLQDLERKHTKEINQHRSMLHDCEMTIHKLRDEIDDDAWNCDICTRYIDNWQNSRLEQESLSIDKAESALTNSLSSTDIKLQQENIINKAIEDYITQSSEDLSDQIEMWMKKYDEDFERLDIDIRVMKDKLEDQLVKNEALRNLYSAHEEEMTAWVTFVEERNRRLQQEIRMQKAAVSIQAWWRGTMVRRAMAKLKKKK